MWKPQTNDEKQEEGTGSVAVAVDKDKGSQYALKWAIDNILNKGQRVTLIHVKQKPSGAPTGPNSNKDQSSSPFKQHDAQSKEIFLSFRCFCSRKDVGLISKDMYLFHSAISTVDNKEIKCEDVVLEHTDIAKAIIEFVSHRTIETLVLGSSSKSSLLRRFKVTDVPTSVSKAAPDFCSVYIISKGKVSSVRIASKKVQNVIPLKTHIQNQESFKPSNPPASEPARFAQNNLSTNSTKGISPFEQQRNLPYEQQRNSQYEQQRNSPYEQQRNSPYEQQRNSSPFEHRNFHDDLEPIRSPFTRGGRSSTDKQSYGGGDMLNPVDISFVSSGRPSTDRMFPSLYDHYDMSRTPRLSNSSDLDNRSFESLRSAPKSMDFQSMSEFSMTSGESGRMSSSSQNMEDVEAEMRRLKIELKQTMDMYSTACKEALSAKQQAIELHRWKMEEEQRLQEARLAEEAALAIAHREKAKCKAALEAAEASQRLAELEAQRRMSAEMKASKETEEKKKALSSLAHSDVRYRKYTIEEIEVATEYFNESRKIGEGGYGPVFKCLLDHTPVAVKVLRPDAAQGRSQFQQEVEVLSCIRHPNMVLLLGACPEYGCLVYEYMANGSLDDCLFRRGDSPVLSWQLRFRIAAEIATGLLFLHQTKPEPLVHRDLKPGNILLDRNYVSKISDVGLARLVPPSVANHVTQYRMTSTAGTFCYIDPEYQQTGMLGIKSDIYSLGIMLLQIITAKSPMGLTHHVERAIEKGQFAEMLDPDVHDWPVEEALCFAKLALNCAELRKKDRPDLGKVVLPELNRLRNLAEETLPQTMLGCSSAGSSPYNSRISSNQEVISDPMLIQSAYDSSRSRVSDPMLRQSGYDNLRSRLSEPQLRQSGYDTSRSRPVAAPTGWR